MNDLTIHPDPIDTLVAAIENREGFGIKGTLPTRLNNPGDLIFVGQKNATECVVVGADKRKRSFCRFATVEDGLAELKAQILRDAGRGKSLRQFIGGYAPINDGNDEKSYLAAVMRALGVSDPTRKLSEILGA